MKYKSITGLEWPSIDLLSDYCVEGESQEMIK